MTTRPADLLSYDRYCVAFSGGKDSLAAMLYLLECGVSPSKIELHHHDVDGNGGAFMDWEVTPAYCRAVAESFGFPIYFSYKQGGFLGEMNRNATPTQATVFNGPNGMVGQTGGKGPKGTRGKFPQVAADLSVRWCSAYLKIDVFDKVIMNDPRFLEGRTLVITGERAEESASRARYATFEPHRADSRNGKSKVRYVDHWRPIHAWGEAQVWALIQKWGVVPHVAYQLGWGRLSCMTCIFGSPDQWATIRAVFPSRFALVAEKETATGSTIQRKASVYALADKGTPYPAALAGLSNGLVDLAQGKAWTQAAQVMPHEWALPAGAFGESAGPT